MYCLSADSPTAQTKWQTKVCSIITVRRRFPLRWCFHHLQKELPYPLLSDPKRVLISALGAGEGGKTKRSHFIFEKGGKLVDKKNPVKPVDRSVPDTRMVIDADIDYFASPKLALEFIQSHSS